MDGETNRSRALPAEICRCRMQQKRKGLKDLSAPMFLGISPGRKSVNECCGEERMETFCETVNPLAC